jgi:hypothetical protein
VTHRLLASGVPCDLHVWHGQVHSIAVAANREARHTRYVRHWDELTTDVTPVGLRV